MTETGERLSSYDVFHTATAIIGGAPRAARKDGKCRGAHTTLPTQKLLSVDLLGSGQVFINALSFLPVPA